MPTIIKTTNDMGNSIKNKLAVLVILFSCNLVNAQNLFIYGNTDVYVNSTNTYYFSLPAGIDLSAITPQWYVYGGTILSQSETTVNIRWTTSGNGSVKVSLPGYFSELFVRITTFSDPPAPPNPIVTSNHCQYSAIVPVGSPPNGVTWYWQGQNPDGRTTDYGSNPYFLAGTTGTYYLRAYKGSTGAWSEDLGSIYVTVGVHGGPLWYKDSDNDGFGDPLVSLTSCTQPSGFVDNNLDCNDSNELIHPNTKWYKDFDGDGYGSDLDFQVACIKPLGYVLRNGDCDDNNSILNPNTLWYSDSDGDGFGNPNITKNQCSRPTGYVANNYDLCPSDFGSHYGCTTPQTGTVSLTNDENYIYTVTYTKPYDLGLEGSASKQEKMEVVAYFDGLGRDKQIVTIRGGGLGEDIITPITYDVLGRKVKDYLSYASIANSGSYRADALLSTFTSVNGFYNTDRYEHTNNPYSETFFETSPLNRPIAQYAPGEAWAKEGGNKPVTTKYLISSADDEVLHFNLSTEGDAGATSYFGDGALEKLLFTDENGHQSATFSDAFGKTLLKRNYLSETEWADTYYVYDGWNNLRFVFPPESEDFLGTLPITLEGSLYLDRYAFQYRYDHSNRMIWKKVPGAEPVIMIYDGRDRLVLTQNGKQRLTSKWSFTKYDALNRPVITGEKVITTTVSNLRDALNGSDWLENYAAYETMDGNQFGYTSNSYPKNLSNVEVYTVSYYDNYNFKTLAEFGNEFTYEKPTAIGECETVAQGTYCFENSEFEHVKGQVTGGQTRILDTDEWIRTTTYFDDRYRPIQNITLNTYQGVIERVSNLYNFPGWLLKTYKEQESTGLNMGISNRFVYDHAGRLLAGYHELFKNNLGNGEVLMAENKYNELGELIEKNLHVENDIPQQSIDYRYNIRGWLESINNVSLTPDVNNNDESNHPKDLFGMELIYNQILPDYDND